MVNTLKVLTKWGADINNLSDEHPSCLMTAVLIGHKDLIEVLIEIGSRSFPSEPASKTLAFFASIGSDHGNPDAFDIMLSDTQALLNPETYQSTHRSRIFSSIWIRSH